MPSWPMATRQGVRSGLGEVAELPGLDVRMQPCPSRSGLIGWENAVVAHGDAVVHGDGVELDAVAAGGVDDLLDALADGVEVDVAGDELGEAVGDGDDRFEEVLGWPELKIGVGGGSGRGQCRRLRPRLGGAYAGPGWWIYRRGVVRGAPLDPVVHKTAWPALLPWCPSCLRAPFRPTRRGSGGAGARGAAGRHRAGGVAVVAAEETGSMAVLEAAVGGGGFHGRLQGGVVVSEVRVFAADLTEASETRPGSAPPGG